MLELAGCADRDRGGELLDPRRTIGPEGGNTFLLAGIGAACLTNCWKDGAGSPMLLSEEVDESGVRNGGLRRVPTAYGTDMTPQTRALNRTIHVPDFDNDGYRDSDGGFAMSLVM